MKKKIIITIIITSLLLVVTSLITLIFYNPFIKIKIKGQKEITLEVNTKYKEEGVKITGTKNKYSTTGKVNTKKLGQYKITYKITAFKTKKTTTRIINVVDTTKPTITLKGNDITLYQNEEYVEPGYTTSDNYDKNPKVTIDNQIDNKKIGNYTITYKVTDSSNNTTTIKRNITVKEQKITKENGITYINGIMLVNKKYSLPSTYNPGVNQTALNELTNLQNEAQKAGHNIPLISSFRSYSRQTTLYNNYVAKDGYELADTYSAKPGHSEHQTGLAFDVGALDNNYGNTNAGKWLANNCYKYGFIIRYLKGKENITGYQYEPWHIRYVGKEHAKIIYEKQITLEEYLGVN